MKKTYYLFFLIPVYIATGVPYLLEFVKEREYLSLEIQKYAVVEIIIISKQFAILMLHTTFT